MYVCIYVDVRVFMCWEKGGGWGTARGHEEEEMKKPKTNKLISSNTFFGLKNHKREHS